MGTHARKGVGRFFLGSAAEGVLRLSDLPVLTVRASTKEITHKSRSFERVIVAIDGSAPSEAATRVALALPAEDRRELTFCSVVDLDRIIGTFGLHTNVIREELRKEARALVDGTLARARERDIGAEGIVVDGKAADSVLALLEERRADLVLLGSHGRHGIQRIFLGSVAESIVRRAAVPVLVVRRVNEAFMAPS